MRSERRELVYKAIDNEREYQESLGPSRTDGSQHTVGDYLVMLDHYLHNAKKDWTIYPGVIHSLDEIRKITAIGVRCMEEHGVIERGTVN